MSFKIDQKKAIFVSMQFSWSVEYWLHCEKRLANSVDPVIFFLLRSAANLNNLHNSFYHKLLMKWSHKSDTKIVAFLRQSGKTWKV